MPDQDGFDILQFVQRRDPDLPVVLFTGHSDVPTAMRAMKEGAYDYLEKPCEPERLVETLRRALNHRALVLEKRYIVEERNREIDHANQGSLAEQLERREHEIIVAALTAENGRVAEAATRLNVPRNTFYDRMAKLKIVAKSFRGT
jgi:two-component system C4-dicarboxylate transport response regulator DctD